MSVEIYNSNELISSGTIISGAVISGRRKSMNVNSGGTACDTTVKNWGNMYVEDGGTAIQTEVISNGCITVQKGLVDSSILNKNGRLVATSGALATNTEINGGRMFIYRDSTAENTIIKSDGALYLESQGATATNTTISKGGFFMVSSGGFAKDTLVGSQGAAAVYELGICSNTIVTYKGAFSVSQGGIASDTTVQSGAKVYIENNGTIHNLEIQNGGMFDILASTEGTPVISGVLTVAGQVTAENDVTGDFTLEWKLSNATSTEYAMVSGLDHLAAAAEYSISVAPSLKAGTYHLADGFTTPAADFSITLKGDDASALGTLTLTSPTLSVNKTTYTLAWKNQEGLYLTVDKVEITPSCNLLQNGVSQIAAWDAKSGTIGFLATDGENIPVWTDIADLQTTNPGALYVTGTGYFKESDSKQDGILLYDLDRNSFSVWTDIQAPDLGYTELYRAENKISGCGIANLNGNKIDDLLLIDENGSFGVLIDGTTYHSIHAGGADLQLISAGNFGTTDGANSLIVKNTADNTYSLWHNSDLTFKTQNWTKTELMTLDNDWIIAGIGDFLGDGTDDIIVWQKSTGDLYAYEDGKSTTQRKIGSLDQAHWEIAAVGDYDGDGKEDLLLRELVSGQGNLAYLASGNFEDWTDLNAGIATNRNSDFNILA